MFLKNGPTSAFFVYLSLFRTQILHKKAVGFSEIRTWIIGVEGEHTDHLTTTASTKTCMNIAPAMWVDTSPHLISFSKVLYLCPNR